MSVPSPSDLKTKTDTAISRAAAFDDLGDVVDRLLGRLLWVVLTLGLASLAATLNRWVQSGWHIQHAVHTLVYLMLLVGVAGGRWLNRGWRIGFLLIALGVNGAGNLVWHGLAGTGLLFMAMVCVFTVVFVTRRMAWIVLGLFFAFVALVAVAVWLQVIPVVSNSEVRLRSGTEWMAQSLAFVALVIAAVVSVSAIQQALRKSLLRLKQRTLALEHEAAERRRVEEQLLQSEKLQAIGRLAGGIAHDFNNQLAGVIGYAEMLKREKSDDAVACEFAENILGPAHRAADLTGKLLAFARKGHYRSEPVDLHAIIREAAAILKRSMDKRIAVVTQLEAYRSTVIGDPTLLQSAVLNVALNARDAMPNGGKLTFTTDVEERTSTIGAENIEARGDHIVLEITDTGVGMDEKTLRRAFEPFFTTKPSGLGTGMGLAAVHGTVHSHGGTLDVQSEKGRGTVFTLTFPLMEEGTEESEERTKVPAAVTVGEGHILVIDDETSVLAMTENLLQGLGYTVTSCNRAGDAVNLYAERWREVDLVLLDLVLPEMTGAMVLDRLKEINPEAAVLLFSGYSSDKDARKLLHRGALGFLQKPFTLQNLSAAVADALAKRSVSQPSDRPHY